MFFRLRAMKSIFASSLCRFVVLCFSLLAWTGRALASTFHPSPDDWRDVSIYQIITDRFYDGDASNNTLSPSTYTPTHGSRIHGGDFKGIEKKLDYIKALGAGAIWISPIQLNVGHGAYHGYHARNFYELSPHWGTWDDLRSMVSNAHARGIYVFLDIVCNHQGNLIGSANSAWNSTFNINGYPPRWNNATNTYPPPFNQLTNFHNNGAIQTFVDPNQILGELSGLDDLRTETQYVRTNMVNIFKYWIEQGNFDGFRIDTVKHVEMGFWQYFNPEIRAFAASIGKSNFFQFGEVYDGSDSKVGSYTGTQAGGAYANDSVLHFPLYYSVNSVFGQANGATSQIESRYAGIAANYHADAHMRLVTFLDNHDVNRFMHSSGANNNTGRLHVATTFLYTSRGIPKLYYGTEQNFNGGDNDANRREDMFNGQWPASGPSVGDKFNMTERTFQHVARLNNFRRLYPSLRRGSHDNQWVNHSGPGILAYSRRLADEEVFVVMNTAASPQTFTARPTIYPEGTKLVNLFDTNETVTVASGVNGIPGMLIPGTSFKMFVADTKWQPLDPVVTQQVPVHAFTSFNATSSLTYRFSKPMNTASVEAAFSINPPRSGTFQWASNGTQMTFTPDAPGFAGFQRYDVRIGPEAMDAMDGNNVYGAFETFFETSANTFTDNVPPTVVITTPEDLTIISNQFQVAGIAQDNVMVDRVEVRLDNGDWQIADGTDSWSLWLDSALAINGSRVLSARSVDTSGNVSPPYQVNLWFFNIPGDYEMRISAGNPNTVTNCDFTVWLADQAYTPASFGYLQGEGGFIGNAISGICAQAQSLFQRERYGPDGQPFSYRFDVPPGIYRTTILQAENWVSAPGERLFDVVINDQTVAENVDIIAESGGRATPLIHVFTNAAPEGMMKIDFIASVQNSRVAGLHVKKIADLDSSGDGVPDWWMLGYFDSILGDAETFTRPEDDFDGDGFTNYEEFIAGTSPVDSASYLSVESIDLEGDARILFDTVPGRRYFLYHAEYLENSEWMLTTPSYLGDGFEHYLIDTNTAIQRVYRIGVEIDAP